MAAGARRLIFTSDGSHSIIVEETGVTYHSKHGAIQESRHVFIDAGLHIAQRAFPDEPLSVLEIGFGTGLNAFLTAINTIDNPHRMLYVALDALPLELSTGIMLNYPEHLGHEELFNAIQLAPWNSFTQVHEAFMLQKFSTDLLQYSCKEKFHLIYFDAFSPETQPELWTTEVFQTLADCTITGGMLVTYCSKSAVRKAMQTAGWKVDKVGGPHGKRDMVRATKLLF